MRPKFGRSFSSGLADLQFVLGAVAMSSKLVRVVNSIALKKLPTAALGTDGW